MRAAIVMGALAVVLVGSGCGNSTSNTNDLAMPMPDLSASTDLTVVGTKTCFEIISCAQGCTAPVQACVQGCASMGTAQAQGKYQALASCALGACTVAQSDGGTPPCASAGDTSQTCLDCVTAKATSATCSTQFNACLTDA